VLYNCGHPANQALTLEMINSQTGTFLHRFSWITDDSLIGKIDYEWNFLVCWMSEWNWLHLFFFLCCVARAFALRGNERWRWGASLA
jgi:hypothetical protein